MFLPVYFVSIYHICISASSVIVYAQNESSMFKKCTVSNILTIGLVSVEMMSILSVQFIASFPDIEMAYLRFNTYGFIEYIVYQLSLNV